MPNDGNRGTIKDMGLPLKYRKAISYYIKGYTKKRACELAGFTGKASHLDVFSRPEVREEVNNRMKAVEAKTNIDREWIINKLVEMIEATPGELIEIDGKGRPSLNFENMSAGLRNALTKITIDESKPAGKWKRTKTKVDIRVPDKIAALKELAVLLGLREEKHKLQLEDEAIEILQRRRNKIAKREEEQDGE